MQYTAFLPSEVLHCFSVCDMLAWKGG